MPPGPPLFAHVFMKTVRARRLLNLVKGAMDAQDDRSTYGSDDDFEEDTGGEWGGMERLTSGMGRLGVEGSPTKVLKRALSSRWKTDFMYHIGICSQAKEIAEFADVKAVCLQGSPKRAKEFAERLIQVLNIKLPLGVTLSPLFKTERFEIYKCGPVLCASHGMGMPSLSILLHEITKLLKYAGATNVLYMRIGTSGGVGFEGGTVVVSTESVTSDLRPILKRNVLGEDIERSCTYRPDLVSMAVNAIKKSPEQGSRRAIKVVTGKTLGVNDFFEEQGRIDGAICEHTEAAKYEWLLKLKSHGISNIEMEGPEFAAFCHHLDIPAVLVCVTLLNRLKGDQVSVSAATLASYSHVLWDAAERIVKHVINKGMVPP